MGDWEHSCKNSSCSENSDGNCLVYSIWHKGREKPDITVCPNYEPMTVERTVCRYAVVIGTGEFCAIQTSSGICPCNRDKCKHYTPLMYKPEEVKQDGNATR